MDIVSDSPLNSSLSSAGLIAHQKSCFGQCTVAKTEIQNWPLHREKVTVECSSHPVSPKVKKHHRRGGAWKHHRAWWGRATQPSLLGVTELLCIQTPSCLGSLLRAVQVQVHNIPALLCKIVRRNMGPAQPVTDCSPWGKGIYFSVNSTQCPKQMMFCGLWEES